MTCPGHGAGGLLVTSLKCYNISSYRITALLLLMSILVATPALAGGSWFKVAAGTSGMAMDDINNGTYRFYDESIDGFNFPDLNSGFSLSFHMGSDISRNWGMGFSWDIQHGHVKGTDVDVTADMKLDANLFMGHLYWTPVQGKNFSLGAAGGLGFVAANGTVRVERGTVSYGEGKTTGTDLAVELMGTAEYALARNKALQLTAGWRLADISKIKFEGATAVKEDGSNLALDYTGYTLKLGVVWRFGGPRGQ